MLSLIIFGFISRRVKREEVTRLKDQMAMLRQQMMRCNEEIAQLTLSARQNQVHSLSIFLFLFLLLSFSFFLFLFLFLFLSFFLFLFLSLSFPSLPSHPIPLSTSLLLSPSISPSFSISLNIISVATPLWRGHPKAAFSSDHIPIRFSGVSLRFQSDISYK